MSDIDSDDDYVICNDCDVEVDVSEINRVVLRTTSKNVMLCLSCKTWLENIDALEKISDDDDEDDYDDDDEDVKPVRMIKKMSQNINRAPSGFVKPAQISDELASFLKKPFGTKMSRTEVTRDINKYIKINGLQDKDNGRKINPDRNLFALLKIDRDEGLTYFNIQKYITRHFIKGDDDAIAQPVRMIYKKYENISFSCCNRKNCVHIKCCGTVTGHVDLYGCDPELANVPSELVSKMKMRRSAKDGIWLSEPYGIWLSEPFEETNLLRRLRLQKTERLQKIENMKFEKQNEKEEKVKQLLTEKLATRLQQKERWESLPVWDKIVELEVQICHKLHGPNWNSYIGGGNGGLGQRLSLYENVRFKELWKTCPVIEQASQAIYNFVQPSHLQIENPYEKKDQPENILVILEKWLEDVDPVKYHEIKGLPRPPPPPFWKKHIIEI